MLTEERVIEILIDLSEKFGVSAPNYKIFLSTAKDYPWWHSKIEKQHHPHYHQASRTIYLPNYMFQKPTGRRRMHRSNAQHEYVLCHEFAHHLMHIRGLSEDKKKMDQTVDEYIKKRFGEQIYYHGPVFTSILFDVLIKFGNVSLFQVFSWDYFGLMQKYTRKLLSGHQFKQVSKKMANKKPTPRTFRAAVDDVPLKKTKYTKS